VPKNIRVYELAREMGMTNAEVLDLCVSLGVGVKSHSSGMVEAQADRVRRKADREGLKREVQSEEVVEEKPARSSKAKPARSSKAKPARSSKAKPAEAGAVEAEPAPEAPAVVEPVEVEEAASEPEPVDAVVAEPAEVEPTVAEAAVVEPVAAEPVPIEPVEPAEPVESSEPAEAQEVTPVVAEPEPAEANPEVAVRVRFCDLAKMNPQASGLVPAQLVLLNQQGAYILLFFLNRHFKWPNANPDPKSEEIKPREARCVPREPVRADFLAAWPRGR
jgi:translation initiation factor IF-2